MIPPEWSKMNQSLEFANRFARANRRMTPGSFGGRTESASPPKPISIVNPTPVEQSGVSLFVANLNAFTQDVGNSLTLLDYSDVLEDAPWAAPRPSTGSGAWQLDLGYYIVAGGVSFSGAALAGLRGIYLEHSVGLAGNRATWHRSYVGSTDAIYLAAAVPIHVTNTDNVVAVWAEQTGQALLDIEAVDYSYLRIMKLA